MEAEMPAPVYATVHPEAVRMAATSRTFSIKTSGSSRNYPPTLLGTLGWLT